MVISMPDPEDMPWTKQRKSVHRDSELIPDPDGIEDTIQHLPILHMDAWVERGWWTVRVRCERDGVYYQGKKSRSYFSALAKSLDVAMVETGHREG